MLPQQVQEEVEYLETPISIKEIEFIIKTLLMSEGRILAWRKLQKRSPRFCLKTWPKSLV